MRYDPCIRLRCLASIFLLCLQPAAFFGVVYHLHEAQGPRWLMTAEDPDYLHFMNAALVGNFQAPAHTDNPGTPLHVLGGAVLRLQHAALGHGDFADDVVVRPEWYLAGLHAAILSLTTLAYFVAGLIVWRSTGSVLAGLLAQFSPWCFWCIVVGATFVFPDALVNGLAALYGALLVRQSAGYARKHRLLVNVLFWERSPALQSPRE